MSCLLQTSSTSTTSPQPVFYQLLHRYFSFAAAAAVNISVCKLIHCVWSSIKGIAISFRKFQRCDMIANYANPHQCGRSQNLHLHLLEVKSTAAYSLWYDCGPPEICNIPSTELYQLLPTYLLTEATLSRSIGYQPVVKQNLKTSWWMSLPNKQNGNMEAKHVPKKRINCFLTKLS